MRRRLPHLIPGVPIAVVLALVGVLCFASRRPPGRVYPLPDGSRLAVEGFTFGKEHRFVHGSGWERLALPMLAGEVKEELQRQSASRDMWFASRGGDTLAIWTFLQKVAPTRGWMVRVVAVDEHGCESQGAWRSYGEYLTDPRLERVDAWQLLSFPRRGKHVRLRIYAGPRWGELVRVADLTVRNPDTGPHPAWRAPPLPAAVRSGDRTFTLVELATGLLRRDVLERSWAGLQSVYGLPVAGARERYWTAATFRIAQNGRPDAEWQPVGITAADATGNAVIAREVALYGKGPDRQVFFGGALWPSEAAWKLRVEFARGAGFAPEELWTVRDVPVPGPDGVAQVSETTRREGLPVELWQVWGPYAAADATWPEWARHRARIRVRFSLWEEGCASRWCARRTSAGCR
jgi:hypothetical protein